VVDDFPRRRIQRPVIVRFHPNPDPIACHTFFSVSKLRLVLSRLE
jgi:hypothetical protein